MSTVDSAGVSAAQAEFSALMLELLARSATELFAGYGHELTLGEPEDGTHQADGMVLGAAIGYTGRLVRGALAIAVDEELALKLDPLSIQLGSDHKLRQDWIGELANQLLGRIKNKLLAYSIDVALSTPVIVSGVQLRVGAQQPNGIRLAFEGQGHRADVWWNAEVDPELELSQEGAPDVQAEGEMLLF